MTSHKNWPVLLTLLLVLSFFLVACERPLPGDGSGDGPDQAPPVNTDLESYPDPGADTTDDASPEYPAPDDELALPADEGVAVAESYPGEESSEPGSDSEVEEAAEGETAEGEAVEGETAEGDTAEGETAEGDTTEGDTTEDDTTEGETAEDEAAEADTSETAASEGETADETPGEQSHTVSAGDTLFSIGMQYGMSWVTIAEANDITNPDSLYIGQVLVIPDLSTTEAAETSESAEETETDEPVETEAAEAAEESVSDEGETSEIIHVVQSGENLYRISLKYGVNMMDVARANDLANFDNLAVGQELIIPAANATEADAEDDEAQTEETQTEETQAEEVAHVVQEGETVFGIAFKYGIAWTKLVEKNDLSSPYTLEAGKTLVIPIDE